MEHLIVEETGYTEKSMSLMKSNHFVMKKHDLAIKMKTFETYFGVVARVGYCDSSNLCFFISQIYQGF